MAKAPPKFVIPPKPASKSGAKGTPWEQFVNYWAAHGYKAFKTNAAAIYAAAKAENIDPITFGALVLNESGGNFNERDSNMGAVGIGQLEPGTFIGPNAFNGGVLPWDSTHKISMADLRNPAINLRLAAAYAGYLQGSHPADWYGRYNAGPNTTDARAGQIQQQFNAKWITKWNPKYVSTTSSTAPPSASGPQVPGGTAPQKQDNTDPWMIVTAKGKLSVVNSPTAPKNALTYEGQPITRSQFKQIWTQTYADTFQAYTGKAATVKDIVSILKNAPSVQGLATTLANRPTFANSPIYKQHAKGFLAVGRNILGNTWNPGGDLKGVIKKAIVGNWDQATFEQVLRQSKEYESGPEYKTNLAQNTSAYQTIYGNPDPATEKLLAQKTKAGWTPDELSSWLRTQPAYKNSQEYQSKMLSLMGQLGLITGAVPTLSEDQINQILSSGDQLGGGTTSTPGVTTPPPGSTQTGVTDVSSTGGYAPRPNPAPPLVSENGQTRPLPRPLPYLGRH